MRIAVVLALVGASGCTCGAEPIQAVTVELRTAPAALDFGAVPVGASVHKTVVVANSGNGPYKPDVQPSLTGDGFLVVNPCELPLGPGAFCDVDVVFAPRTEGDLTGAYVVHGPDGDLTVPLTGHADPAELVLAPDALDFGSVT